jgi:hypothetical protein
MDVDHAELVTVAPGEPGAMLAAGEAVALAGLEDDLSGPVLKDVIRRGRRDR